MEKELRKLIQKCTSENLFERCRSKIVSTAVSDEYFPVLNQMITNVNIWNTNAAHKKINSLINPGCKYTERP